MRRAFGPARRSPSDAPNVIRLPTRCPERNTGRMLIDVGSSARWVKTWVVPTQPGLWAASLLA
jgi:hypothetical protein